MRPIRLARYLALGLMIGGALGAARSAGANPAPAAPGPAAAGIRTSQLAPFQGAISRDQAVQEARTPLPGVVAQATSIRTTLVSFSDDHYADVSPQTGQIVNYHFQNTPAWVVSFEGISLPSHGPHGAVTTVNHELNVVIDARTGQYMEMYSYQ